MISQTKRTFKHFIGIDLGGGRGKNTAVSVLQAAGDKAKVVLAGQKSPQGIPWYDEILTEFLKNLVSDGVVAMDAALTMPACLRCNLSCCPGVPRCQDPAVLWLVKNAPLNGRRTRGKPRTTPYTQRVSEALILDSYKIAPREALGGSLGSLTARAIHLRRRWKGEWELNRNLIEVYPKATLCGLFGAAKSESYRKKASSWEARAALLESLSKWLDFEVWREPALANVHVFEAVVSALSGYLWAVQDWQIPKGLSLIAETDGWIWAPVPVLLTER